MKIAIAGYGVEGESSYRYWDTPDNQLVIVDETQPQRPLPVDASTMIGDDAFTRLNGFDMVIRTPGLAPRKITTDGKVWSATNEFFAKCPAPIIGVTGSKGKGTTCSLIASMLRAAGRNVYLVGNIGVPALDVLNDVTADDIVVYELSSFQLWDVERSPHVAVILMIEPDHLDVHSGMEEYLQAKGNITRFQNAADMTIYNDVNELSRQLAAASKAHHIAFPSPQAAHVADGYFWYGEQKLCSTDTLQLPGPHNLENACAAISAALNCIDDFSAIEQGLKDFTGLPHRLKFVREVNDVSYYDDSIATTPGSAIAAIRAFDQPKVLIVGGSDKGADYTQLIDTIASDTSVRAVVTIGQLGSQLADMLTASKFEGDVERVSSARMNEIIQVAASMARLGDVIILSPACASFDMFKSYSDRGDQFIAAVTAL